MMYYRLYSIYIYSLRDQREDESQGQYEGQDDVVMQCVINVLLVNVNMTMQPSKAQSVTKCAIADAYLFQ